MATKVQADEYNRAETLKVKGNSAMHVFESRDHGNVMRLDKECPVGKKLELCVGCVVMISKNCQGLYNGQSGRITGFKDEKPIVLVNGESKTLNIEQFDLTTSATHKQASIRHQFPLIVAFAM